MPKKSKFWTPMREAQLKELWPSDASLKDIRVKMLEGTDDQISISSISQKASCAGLPSRFFVRKRESIRALNPRRITQPMSEATGYLAREAAKRGIAVSELIRRIMSMVTKDRMVNAILDDAPEAALVPELTDTVTAS